MNWGKSIVIAILTFMAIIIAMVVISVRQNIYLVADDYYQQELKYQQQIDKMENYLEMDGTLDITYSKPSGTVQVAFPQSGESINGEIIFFRPSDARFDFTLAIAPDSNGVQQLDLSDKLPGLWKLKVSWEANGKAYYKEQNIVL